jgi:tetratricopeptide (TPR) repeat protein
MLGTQLDSAESRGLPDPAEAADLPEFIALLDRLRVQSGEPSYRTLARRVGVLMRPPRTVAQSTIGAVFQPRRRRLDLDVVVGIVRALTADELKVDRWREAYLRILREAKSGGPAGVFRQLPADLATFTGREVAMKQLIAVASARNGDGPTTLVISAIEGMAGVGKTQLAVHAAHGLVRAGRFTDLQLYVNLHGFDPEHAPADPSAVLDAFLRQLDVPAQKIPAATDERAAMFRDKIHGKNALILLDNAASEEQVRDLMPASPSCLVMITSRRSLAGLDGAAPLQLDVFTQSEALELLTRIAGSERIAAEAGAAADLVEACGRLPLALALTAAQLRARPARTMADLVERLRRQGMDAVGAGGRFLRPVFDLSYRGIGPDAKRLFRLLALHPGADFTALAAAALTGLGPRRVDDLLEHLVNEYLLQHRPGDRLDFHDLLKLYAAERLATDEAATDREAALHRLFSWYLNTADAAARCVRPQRRHSLPEPAAPGLLCQGFPDAETAQAWLQDEYANLLAVQRTAAARGAHDVAARLARPLWETFSGRGQWDQWIDACTIAADSARRISEPDLEAMNLLDLGTGLMYAGRTDDAVVALTRVIGLRVELGDVRGEATARLNLAVLHYRSGRLSPAQDLMEQAVTLNRSIGNTFGEAAARENLATIAADRGDLETALNHRTIVLKMQRELDDRFNEAVTMTNLGDTLSRLGRLDEAVSTLDAAIVMNREVGHRHAEAKAWMALGETHKLLGDVRAAVDALEQARSLFCGIDDDAEQQVIALLDILKGPATT